MSRPKAFPLLLLKKCAPLLADEDDVCCGELDAEFAAAGGHSPAGSV